MAKPPAQKPGKSEQVVVTPPEFMEAVKRKLGINRFSIDLAADDTNTQAPIYYDEATDSLVQSWVSEGWGWLNPPFADIEPWVAKAWIEAQKGAKIAMLLPASVGSNWFRSHVDGKAFVILLNGRLTFVGHTKPYPKDLILCLYTKFLRGGYYVWDWKHEGQ